MPNENEIVIINIPHLVKVELYSKVTSRMENLGYNTVNYGALDLGFELPADWPFGRDTEITMAQLVVIAKKLDMRISITELFIEPRQRQDGG